MRTIVELPEDQLTALSQICSAQHISRAEAVRRAISRLIEESKIDSTNVGFGSWKHKRLNAHAHVDAMRNEWST